MHIYAHVLCAKFCIYMVLTSIIHTYIVLCALWVCMALLVFIMHRHASFDYNNQRNFKVKLADLVLETSVKDGFLRADVNKTKIKNPNMLSMDYCTSRLVALEREDAKNHFHLQIAILTRATSVRLQILVCKYMDMHK